MIPAQDYSRLTEHPVLTMPQPAGGVLLTAIAVACTMLLVAALIRARRDHGTWLLILLTGLACCGMEGFAEYMAMNYHPEIGGQIAYRAWTMPVPIHIVLSYMLYFGAPGYVLLVRAERGMTVSAWWRQFVILTIAVFTADFAAVHFGAWIYYGRQPFVVLGVPLFWMLCNVTAIYAFTAVAHLCLSHLEGARKLLMLIIAPVGLSMTWAGVALPIGNALHSDAGPVVTAIAALLTCAICLLLSGLAIGYFRTVAGRKILP